MEEISYLRFLSYENIFRGIFEKVRDKFGTNFTLKNYSVSDGTLSDLWRCADEDFCYESEDAGYLLFKAMLSTTSDIIFSLSIDSTGSAIFEDQVPGDELDFLYDEENSELRKSYFLSSRFDLKGIRDFNFIEIAVENILNLLLFGQKHIDQREKAIKELLDIKETVFSN